MPIKTLLLLMPALLLTACRSTQEVEFASVDALTQSQYASQVPAWFPPNAKALKLKVDKSTHEFILRFEFARPQNFPPPASNCRKTDRPLRISPPMSASWWPGDIESALASYLEIFYDCGPDGILLMRGLPEKTTAYFWR